MMTSNWDILTRKYFKSKGLKKFVKVCLRSSKAMQISLQFDEFFDSV